MNSTPTSWKSGKLHFSPYFHPCIEVPRKSSTSRIREKKSGLRLGWVAEVGKGCCCYYLNDCWFVVKHEVLFSIAWVGFYFFVYWRTLCNPPVLIPFFFPPCPREISWLKLPSYSSRSNPILSDGVFYFCAEDLNRFFSRWISFSPWHVRCFSLSQHVRNLGGKVFFFSTFPWCWWGIHHS